MSHFSEVAHPAQTLEKFFAFGFVPLCSTNQPMKTSHNAFWLNGIFVYSTLSDHEKRNHCFSIKILQKIKDLIKWTDAVHIYIIMQMNNEPNVSRRHDIDRMRSAHAQ